MYAPAWQRFNNQGQFVGTPSVRDRPDGRHLPVAPGRPPDDPAGPPSFSVLLSPLTLWLWIGGAIMAVGTVLAAFPGRRRRRPTDPVSAPVAEPTADASEPRSSPPRDRRVALSPRLGGQIDG